MYVYNYHLDPEVSSKSSSYGLIGVRSEAWEAFSEFMETLTQFFTIASELSLNIGGIDPQLSDSFGVLGKSILDEIHQGGFRLLEAFYISLQFLLRSKGTISFIQPVCFNIKLDVRAVCPKFSILFLESNYFVRELPDLYHEIDD